MCANASLVPAARPIVEAPAAMSWAHPASARGATTNDKARGQSPAAAPALLLQIRRRAKRKLEPQTRLGDAPEVCQLGQSTGRTVA